MQCVSSVGSRVQYETRADVNFALVSGVCTFVLQISYTHTGQEHKILSAAEHTTVLFVRGGYQKEVTCAGYLQIKLKLRELA